MFSVETLIIVGVVLFGLGGIAGTLLGRSLFPPRQEKELEQRLQASRDELTQYQQDVGRHFAETSQLINTLTQNYRDLHEHLSTSAMRLTSPDISQKILEAAEGQLDHPREGLLEETRYEPPKDWAPKTPGQVGTLSEEFGLNDLPEDESIEAATARDQQKAG